MYRASVVIMSISPSFSAPSALCSVRTHRAPMFSVLCRSGACVASVDRGAPVWSRAVSSCELCCKHRQHGRSRSRVCRAQCTGALAHHIVHEDVRICSECNVTCLCDAADTGYCFAPGRQVVWLVLLTRVFIWRRGSVGELGSLT